MDGCTIHKSIALVEMLKENNKKKLINVPYSPQFNPIEFFFNPVKSDIKKNNITTKKGLDTLINKIIKKANKNRFQKYYDHTYLNLKNAISN